MKNGKMKKRRVRYNIFILLVLSCLLIGCANKNAKPVDGTLDETENQADSNAEKNSESNESSSNTESMSIKTGTYIPEDSDYRYSDSIEISFVEDNKVYITITTNENDRIAMASVVEELTESTMQQTQYMIETSFIDSWNNESYLKICFDCKRNTLIVDTYVINADPDAWVTAGVSGNFLYDSDQVYCSKDTYSNITQSATTSHTNGTGITEESDRKYLSDMGNDFACVTQTGLFQIVDSYYGQEDGYYYYELADMMGGKNKICFYEQNMNIPSQAYLAGIWNYYYNTDGLVACTEGNWYDKEEYQQAYDFYLSKSNELAGINSGNSNPGNTYQTTPSTNNSPTFSSSFDRDYDTTVYDENTGLWLISYTTANKTPIQFSKIITSDYRDGYITMLPEYTYTGNNTLDYVFFNIYFVDEEGNNLLTLKEKLATSYLFDDNTRIAEVDGSQGAYYIQAKQSDGSWESAVRGEDGDFSEHVRRYKVSGDPIHVVMMGYGNEGDWISVPINDINSEIYGIYIQLDYYNYAE